MSKFKVGDKVRRVDGGHLGMVVGDTDTVEFVTAGGNLCLSRYKPASGEGSHYHERFELVNTAVQIKPTNPKEAIGSAKLPLHLLPAAAMAHTATAFYEGATKYGAYNWRVAGVRASTYQSAAKRHLDKWFNGEDCDPATKVHHLANAAACCMILLDAEVQGKLNDDRPPRQGLQGLYDKLALVQQHLTTLHAGMNPVHHTEKPNAE